MKARRTSPDHQLKSWPPGVRYIIGNEGCERFSFYGMRSILQVHLTILFALKMGVGESNEAAEAQAQHIYHLFVAGVYATPMIGAIISDRLLGKFNTVIWLSLVYCAGHAVLALTDNSLQGMYIGLSLIAVGSGGIKPCVSANVGDQFGRGNWHLVEKIFQMFYFIINLGSFAATLTIPLLRKHYGAGVAFAIPGILMFIATVLFWLGRHKFVHVPPKPGGKLGCLDVISSSLLFLPIALLMATDFLATETLVITAVGGVVLGLTLFFLRQRIQQDDGFLAVGLHALRCFFTGESRRTARNSEKGAAPLARNRFWSGSVQKFGADVVEGPIAVLRVIGVFCTVSVFWALFDQHGSSWVRQARDMKLDIFGLEILPSQVQAANPLMVMLLIPLVSLVIYPGLTKLGWKMTPLRRMSLGMFIGSTAFASVALIQAAIDTQGTGQVHILWQMISYLLMTLSEVMVSITGLEFAYTQAPRRMKSTIMGFWMLSVWAGNMLVAFLSRFEGLELVDFFWLFAALMAGAAVIFSVVAWLYKGRSYVQE